MKVKKFYIKRGKKIDIRSHTCSHGGLRGFDNPPQTLDNPAIQDNPPQPLNNPLQKLINIIQYIKIILRCSVLQFVDGKLLAYLRLHYVLHKQIFKKPS